VYFTAIIEVELSQINDWSNKKNGDCRVLDSTAEPIGNEKTAFKAHCDAFAVNNEQLIVVPKG
jgi:hypothetical protein